jgi:hypothetical protein
MFTNPIPSEHVSIFDELLTSFVILLIILRQRVSLDPVWKLMCILVCQSSHKLQTLRCCKLFTLIVRQHQGGLNGKFSQ